MHCLEHAFFDTLKVMPFIFIIYLLIEFFEHKNNTALSHTLMKTTRLGPLYGALLGSVPQCGFSVIAADLFSKKSITLGTLLAIFIATSDEAVPIILSIPSQAYLVISLVAIKIIIAVISGFVVDLLFKPDTHREHCHVEEKHDHFHGNCESCDGGILKSALVHTVKLFVFIFIANFVFCLAIESIGETRLADLLLKGSVFQPFIAGAVGLVPNCAASVLLTESFLSGAISFGSLVSGLSSGAGVGLLLLFKRNKNYKQNLMILSVLYAIGVIGGIIIQLVIS